MAATLIRRLRENGTLVTYLPNAEVCRVVGISASALACWSKQGLVRMTDRLSGSRNYALLDVAHIKKLGPKGCKEAGIQLTPDAYLASQRRWYGEVQDGTRLRAEAHGEVWDDYDIKFLIENLEAGRKIEIIAKALGRTFTATADRIDHLRASGDLPAVLHGDVGWLNRVVPLLTREEKGML